MTFDKTQIPATDYFRQLGAIAALPDINTRYSFLYDLLVRLCAAETEGMQFSNLFSRLGYVAKLHRLNDAERYRLNSLRRNCNQQLFGDKQLTEEDFGYDLRTLAEFTATLFETDVPLELQDLPLYPRTHKQGRTTIANARQVTRLRALVKSWDHQIIVAESEELSSEPIRIDYRENSFDNDLDYLFELLEPDMQINLIDCKVDENNTYYPRLIIIEPDFLIDISALAECFKDYGHHPYNYLLQKIEPRMSNHYILIGRIAGQLLDDLINEKPERRVTYKESLMREFKRSALDIAATETPPDFHPLCQQQMVHLRNIISHQFKQMGIDKENAILEPSFYCEHLGIQGRMDLITIDYTKLIEQKSGKQDEFNHTHRENHYVQMMLYRAVLHYNRGISNKELDSYLLYSRYPDALFNEKDDSSLFRQIMETRNRIVKNELLFARGGIREAIQSLSTELLNVRQKNDRFWQNYLKPPLARTIHRLQNNDELTMDYFCRLFTFLSKELIISKLGSANQHNTGFADTWNLPVEKKREAGNLMDGLRLVKREESDEGAGIDTLTFEITRQEELLLPNFRLGDIVILYLNEQEQPDVRKQFVWRGTLTVLETDCLVVKLRHPQHNETVFSCQTPSFVIEHDFMESSHSSAFKGLFALLEANPDRKELILRGRHRGSDDSVRLIGDYGSFNDPVLKAKQARDIFLLVGPPGTGKTSHALRSMVEEQLRSSDGSLLLMAYTNRAVDEICEVMEEIIRSGSDISERADYIRIGSEMMCDARFSHRRLSEATQGLSKEQIIRKIQETAVFVGTTAAVSAREVLFKLKAFELTIIDEASQLLETHLLPLLCVKHNGENAIRKCILIGDHKQLPAVVQQPVDASVVEEPLLLEVGLTNCRQSLFQRFINLFRDQPASIGMLCKQARMHEVIAQFSNSAFYANRLEVVPIAHQQKPLSYPHHNVNDPWEELVASARMAFIPVERLSLTVESTDKANLAEAKVVASLVEALLSLYRQNDKPFSEKSVGIIVPYRNQIAMIRKELKRLNQPVTDLISIDTVERYQGSQRDVIIYSFTIKQRYQLHFLTANSFIDEITGMEVDQKLNVALTRAREQLFLVGNPELLSQHPILRQLISFIKESKETVYMG